MKSKIILIVLICFYVGITGNSYGQTLCLGTELFSSLGTNGRIGIGTCSPQFKLHLLTDPSLPGDFINNGFRIEQTGSSGAVLGLFNTAPGLNGHNYGLMSTNNGNSEGPGKLLFFDQTMNTVRMSIARNGYVGVNTIDPKQTLHVVGNSFTTGNSTIGIENPSTSAAKLHVHKGAIMVSGPNSSGGPMILFSDDVSASAHPNGRWGIEYITSHGLNFWQPWNPITGGGTNYLMLLKDDGKIGMGIDPTNPNSFPAGYRLYVKTGILTEKLKVALYATSDWSDYVFDDGYKLTPLKEVESYIKSNKHLPNMPSAEELVNGGGIDEASPKSPYPH